MEEEALFKISPSYSLMYELGKPEGKKISKSITILIVFVIIYLCVLLFKQYIPLDGLEYVKNVDVISIFTIVGLILIAIQAIVLVSKIVLKVMQYKSISYSFYEDHLIYEDNFLNQRKKVIQYSNVKEIEVTRTIWDRVNNRGVITIYTNAENETSNGLVLYCVKDSDYWYKKVDEVIHSNTKYDEEEIHQEVIKEKILEEEENFKNSLKN